MRPLYTLVLTLLTPLVLLRLLARGWRNRGYWSRWSERFGYFPPPALHHPIWIHAVSLGEVQAAAPLARALLQRYPDRSLVMTTTTPTGSNRVKELFGDHLFHVYLPYDLPGSVRRFLERIRPELLLVMETELWPNLFAACAKRGVPVVIGNARLSPKSAAGYRRIGPLVRETLGGVRLIAAQGAADAERFIGLGAERQKVLSIGNLKYDMKVPDGVAESRTLRQALGRDRLVWVAASTHEGEEEQILDAFERVRQERGDCLLLLVPRHPERFSRVAALCAERKLKVVRRTQGQACGPEVQVFLGDTLGELMVFYAAADIAFVGGSLVPTGGHNLLEPALLGVPSLTGPHLFNFREISDLLLQAGAAERVEDAGQLAEAVLRLAGDRATRERMGQAGRRVVETNRGALDRLLDCIAPLL